MIRAPIEIKDSRWRLTRFKDGMRRIDGGGGTDHLLMTEEEFFQLKSLMEMVKEVKAA